jgi:hypothetical protein
MILKRNNVNYIGKDVMVYCKFWKKNYRSKSEREIVAYFLTQVVLKP